MVQLEREFYRSFRGPRPGDEEDWSLDFDPVGNRLCVRRRWWGAADSGVADLTLESVLSQPGAARDALLDLLFDRATIDA